MEVEAIKTDADINAIYRKLKSGGHVREAECFMIGCNFALRAGDLLKLTFEQVSGSHLAINEQKTSKHKQIPITPPVKEAIERLRIYYQSLGIHAKYLFQGTGVRAKHLKKPISIQYLLRKYKETGTALGLGYNIGTHSMRKTFGFRAYKEGVDIHRLQELFNHGSPKTTLTYIGVTKREVENLYFTNAIDIED